MLLVFPGSNQTGAKVRGFRGYSFDQLVVRDNAIVVYPDVYKGLWNDALLMRRSTARAEGADDVAFIGALIDQFHAVYGSLPVYAAGYSNGGQMVIRLVHETPHKLAGAAQLGQRSRLP